MANITYSNLDKQNGIYTAGRKMANAVDTWNKNPYYALGSMIGQAVFEPYFEKKRSKSRAEANFMILHPDATKEQFETYYDAIKSGMSRNDALAKVGLAPMREYGASDDSVKYQGSKNSEAGFGDLNKTFDSYQQAYNQTPNGKVLYEGRTSASNTAPSADNIPRTPAQANKPAVTTENTGLMSPAAQYQKMAKAVAYNPGNTPVANPTGGSAEQIPTSYAGDFRDAMRGYVAPVNPNYDYIPGEGSVNDINNAGLALAQSGFTPAVATLAGAANIGNGYAMPGHDPNLEWHPFATQPSIEDAAARELALKWLEENG